MNPNMENKDFPLDHCSRWSGIPQDGLTPANRQHIEILVRACRTGAHNLPVNWQRAKFGKKWAYTEFMFRGEMATADFNALARLVILAHEECVRISIEPHTFQHLKIRMFTRYSREGSMFERHPTIDQAVAEIRKAE